MNIPSCQQWLQDAYWIDPPSYIHQLLPREPGEYMIICGRPGIGKSNLAFHMGCCLATGLPFLDFATEATKVGHIIMEGSRKNLKDRMVKILPQYPSESLTRNYYNERAEPCILETHNDYYRSKFEDCRVVILDNLKHITDSRYLENKYAGHWIKDIYQPFLKDIGAVGILTHHLSKNNEKSLISPDDVGRLKGAGEYAEDATSVILLERRRQGHISVNGKFAKRDENALTLYFPKARMAEDVINPIHLVKNYEWCRFDRDGDGS